MEGYSREDQVSFRVLAPQNNDDNNNNNNNNKLFLLFFYIQAYILHIVNKNTVQHRCFFNVIQNTAIAHEHAVRYYFIQIVLLLQKPVQQRNPTKTVAGRSQRF